MIKGRISVIILTYQNFYGVYETLDSVFCQNYPDIELIIGDDGSPNANENIPLIEKYIEDNKRENIQRVQIIKGGVNVGIVKNVNRAIKATTGEYIKYIASEDSFVDENVLSIYKEFLDKSGCLICCAKVNGVTEDGKIRYKLASCEDNYDLLRSLSPEGFRNKLFWRNCIPAPAVFVKKELYEKYGYHDEDIRMIEDYPYWIHLSSIGVKFAFFDDRLINYKLTGVSSSGNYSRAFLDDLLLVYDKYIFPYDKRYGAFQKGYNHLKREGLGAYLAIADWNKYGLQKKIFAFIRYGLFFAFIKFNNNRPSS